VFRCLGWVVEGVVEGVAEWVDEALSMQHEDEAVVVGVGVEMVVVTAVGAGVAGVKAVVGKEDTQTRHFRHYTVFIAEECTPFRVTAPSWRWMGFDVTVLCT
jgi:hypothetical protein